MPKNQDADTRMLQRLRSLPATTREAEYKLIDEVDILCADNALYYRHEAGVTFTINIGELSGTLDIRLAESIPQDAKAYTPIAGSNNEALVDAWTEACDKVWKGSAFA
jgi:hypothetical protein